MKTLLLILFAIVLVACSKADNGVRVSSEKPSPPAPVQKARSEPVFYNGKTYQFTLLPNAGGIYALSVGGMSAAQQKDAIAVSTSSLRYFACPDGKTGKLTNQPSYVANTWKMSARCA